VDNYCISETNWFGSINELCTTSMSVKPTVLGTFNELRSTTLSVKPTGLDPLMNYGQLLCQ
jgi:hypothetical protein